jgi:hypothetical protein
MTDDNRVFCEAAEKRAKSWGFIVGQLLDCLRTEIEQHGSGIASSEVIAELWQAISEAVMFCALMRLVMHRASEGSLDQGLALHEEDRVIVESEGSAPIAEIVIAADALDCDPCLGWGQLNRNLALRMAFRAYVAREFFSAAFKNAKTRNALADAPMMPNPITLLLFPRAFSLAMPWIFEGGDLALAPKAQKFIDTFTLLVHKALNEAFV